MKVSKCPICGAKPEAYAYFSSTFKKLAGISPSEYQIQYQNNKDTKFM